MTRTDEQSNTNATDALQSGPVQAPLMQEPGNAPLDEREIAAIVFDSIDEGVFTVDQDCRITSFNAAAERISGFSRAEALGQFCFDIFRTDLCQAHCALRSTLSNGQPSRGERVTIITRDGRQVAITVNTTILRDSGGRRIGAVEFFRDLTAIENLRRRLQEARHSSRIVSANPRMQRIVAMLPQIAESECNVLIQGPSGAGKELVAEAIHDLSPRKDNRYIRVNCAALPENLLESELFGYAKGAFTDAKRDKPGLFFLAQKGTILLDEITEMPVSLQSKLLRVLSNGEFQPLGSVRTLKTDARILSSTNSNIEQRIKQGAFREDLFYRINVINIHIPPLCERPEDIPLLVNEFLQRQRKQRHKAITSISNEALQCLRRYPFPGNVRELENAIEHAFVLCRGEVIGIDHLPERIRRGAEQASSRLPAGSEAAIIAEALQRHGGNKAQTAKELGIDRTTLWRRMKRLGLNPRAA